ncbi:MAG TPA: A/G-specific adenine glycosylase [Casimicrobiaceae bacterium]|jgi:A/G-specific adenine glycosylase
MSPHADVPRPWAERLVAWHAIHGRHDLPWQRTREAYRIWLSEVMLQQTQVATVIPYFERFVARFPDVRALADAPIDAVLECWAGLGYYRRAHHLHAAAQAVMRDHRGVFPLDAATLEALPGIGRSTAAAIAAFAEGERNAILDGNVKRVLARHAGIDGYPGEPRVAAALWDVAESRMPGQDVEAYTQAMMDLGATVCIRTRPRCAECPVAEDCVARRDGRIADLPSPRPRKPLPQRSTVVLLIERGGTLLFERRPATGIWGGLWSFPEVAGDADIVDAMHARYGVAARVTAELAPVRHAFTHFALTLHPRRIAVATWPPRAESPGRVWLTRDDARHAALPSPIRKIVAALPDT